MLTHSQVKKRLLKDPEVKREYNKLAVRYQIISDLIGARIKNELTQKQLAERIGTKQSAIARLEAGNVNPSIDFLEKIAKGMNCTVTVRIR